MLRDNSSDAAEDVGWPPDFKEATSRESSEKPGRRLPTAKNGHKDEVKLTQAESFDAALAQVAARHVAEVNKLQKKLEASIQHLTANHMELTPREAWEDDGRDPFDDLAHVDAVLAAELRASAEQDLDKAEPKSSGNRGGEHAGQEHEEGNAHHDQHIHGRVSLNSSDSQPSTRQRNAEYEPKLIRRFSISSAASTALGVPAKDVGTGERSLLCIVSHPYFDAFAAMMILLNAGLIGADTQFEAMDEAVPAALDALNLFCFFFFLVELLLRMGAHKAYWFVDKELRIWNYFDALLVALSLVDVMIVSLMQNDEDVLGGIKMLKTVRIVRVFRVFRFFRQLTELVLMIKESIKSLMWALVLLAIIVYVFAISITSTVSAWVIPKIDTASQDWLSSATSIDSPYAPLTVSLLNSYGSLNNTIYTLILAVFGGVSWGDVCDPLLHVGWIPVLLLCVYIAFVVLAVLNVVTGVFVDNAFRATDRQRGLAIQKEMDRKEQYITQATEFFAALDQDASGGVTTWELSEMLADKTLSAYFRVLGFEIDDADRFIDLLDSNESGSICRTEFLEGCLRYRGTAQGVDIHTVIREVKDLKSYLLEIHHNLGMNVTDPASERKAGL